ncbi:protein DpdE [Orlajensenia leifsoniae]|uniref:Restriction endonuclease subunit R n=1 Tax=Orlajensenia leifsoniae TaxID=2561933 RepID=A0A4Y9QWT6_9MICO|nr:protein DpdE [Leifsonia flava]TFV95395.1 restriction endonuclease subunit R [Leifsonia flava]
MEWGTRGISVGAFRLGVGDHVTFAGAPGIGIIAGLADDLATVEFFESVAEPSVGVVEVATMQLSPVYLGRQTRVFLKDTGGQWHAGRITADGVGADGRPTYYVRLPNSNGDIEVPGRIVRVRWDKRPKHPVDILIAGGNESPRYRDSRLPVRAMLLADRASSASATGIASSGVQMHSHQVAAAFRIIRDPVQRYLLADEVGMGKTIEAGFVIRQTLIDDPSRKVGVVCPDALVEQWRSELRDKFFIGDFGQRVKVVGHSDTRSWAEFGSVDLLVVDEAHLLATVESADEPTYRMLAAAAHSAPRLLLLSATPFTRASSTHLAMLHLLDRDLFSWERRAEFELLLDARRELALAVYALDEDPDPENPDLLEYQFGRLTSQLPADDLLSNLAAATMRTFPSIGAADQTELSRRVAMVRAHVSETYRLHHRVIRNRRHSIGHERLDDDGIMAPFSVTGRSRPRVEALDSRELDLAADVVERWVSGCSIEILDHDLPPAPYGRLAGLLMSRVGGTAEDLADILRSRTEGGPTLALAPEEREIVEAAPLLPFELALSDELGKRELDALPQLAERIAGSTRHKGRTVVFCGRGSLASALLNGLQDSMSGRRSAFGHLTSQTDAEREESVAKWRANGGVLVVDESGDVGRNLQDATLVIHLRLPANPNQLEQRIGRVDRYGRALTARSIILSDTNSYSLFATWARLLASGFGSFDRSVSAEHEAIDRLSVAAWRTLVQDGVEAFAALGEDIREAIADETRRINELDALESSWDSVSQEAALAERISRYDDRHTAIDQRFRALIAGDDGFRFEERPWDGSIRFAADVRAEPLLSPQLVGLLNVAEKSRIGNFDRWSVKPARRLFRRGNPFIDGVERVLELDDRGQASAMWRLDPLWAEDTLVYFGFDFLVEADTSRIVELLGGSHTQFPTALRRCDWALPPFEQRVWIASSTMRSVNDERTLEFLNAPFNPRADTNLNRSRISSLHEVLGWGNLATTATNALDAAKDALLATTSLREVTSHAAAQVANETDVMLARSRARAAAAGMVADPDSFAFDVDLGRAVQRGIESPSVRELAVTCLVRSAIDWQANAKF